MKAYRKLTIRSLTLDADGLINQIRSFCAATERIGFLEHESSQYTAHVGAPSCIVSMERASAGLALISLSAGKKSALELTNIVPDTTGQIYREEANEVAIRFANALALYAKKAKPKFSVVCSSDTIDVHDVLRDVRVRRCFDQFMVASPKSSHPSDIRRLDRFICELSRYHRGVFYADRLKALLIEDFAWSEEDASRCSRRVEIGLEVLEARRRW